MAQPFSYLPEPARSLVRTAWKQVPSDIRGDLQTWLPYALSDAGGAFDLLGFIAGNYRTAFDQREMKIAIVGPAGAGKSTLYNRFVPDETNHAAVGEEPGTTREVQVNRGTLFTLIDTPGADAVGPVSEREREIAFQAALDADFLLMVFDAVRGIEPADRELFDSLKALGKPFVVVLNKMDRVAKGDRKQTIESAAAKLGMDPAELIGVSATTGDNLGRVVLSVTQMDSRLLAVIGEALPEYRSKLAWQRTITAASAAASVALIPLPLADIIPLLAIQTGLILNIARIYGYEITSARAAELLAAFGLAFIARSVQRQLSKFLGVPGWLLSAAIAGAATVAIGYTSMLWFEHGERPTNDQLQAIVHNVSVYLRDSLKTLRLRRSDGATLKQHVQSALEGMPDALNPSREQGKLITSHDRGSRKDADEDIGLLHLRSLRVSPCAHSS